MAHARAQLRLAPDLSDLLGRPATSSLPTAAPIQVAVDLLKKLGSGAHGIVWLARYRTSSGIARLAAVKVLHTDLRAGGQHAERLRDEARMLACLRHRAVVSLVDLLDVDGRPALVTEYVEGIDLRDLLRGGRLGTRATAELVAELAGALEEAHAGVPDRHGQLVEIVHRDLKPGNVRLTRSGGVRLLDFGAGRALLDERESRSGLFTLGTTGYLAPELEDHNVSCAVDLFGLGVLAWECATGQSLGSLAPDPVSYHRQVSLALDRLPDPVLRGPIGALLRWEPFERPRAGTNVEIFERIARRAEGRGLRALVKSRWELRSHDLSHTEVSGEPTITALVVPSEPPTLLYRSRRRSPGATPRAPAVGAVPPAPVVPAAPASARPRPRRGSELSAWSSALLAFCLAMLMALAMSSVIMSGVGLWVLTQTS